MWYIIFPYAVLPSLPYIIHRFNAFGEPISYDTPLRSLYHTICYTVTCLPVAAEYKQLLEEIRALPDFHNFLQPLNATNLLSSLPPDSIVVIFNIYETRCDALALIAGIDEVLPVPLEKFGLNEAEQLQRRLQSVLLQPEQRQAEDGDRATFRLSLNAPLSISVILEELWCKVVQPVLTALGYSVSSADCHLISYLY
jgi:hypothetical protein